MDCESAGSRTRGTMLQRTAVALLAAVCRCCMKRSFEYSLDSRRTSSRAQRCHGSEEGMGGVERRLENRMVSVLCLLSRSSHAVKYMRKVVTA